MSCARYTTAARPRPISRWMRNRPERSVPREIDRGDVERLRHHAIPRERRGMRGMGYADPGLDPMTGNARTSAAGLPGCARRGDRGHASPAGRALSFCRVSWLATATSSFELCPADVTTILLHLVHRPPRCPKGFPVCDSFPVALPSRSPSDLRAAPPNPPLRVGRAAGGQPQAVVRSRHLAIRPGARRRRFGGDPGGPRGRARPESPALHSLTVEGDLVLGSTTSR